MLPARNPSVVSPLLLGRQVELASLAELIDQALNGSSRIALISGEAGAGKSRLTAEIQAIATHRGMRLLQGRCFEQDRSLPYAPLLDALHAFQAKRSAPELASAAFDCAGTGQTAPRTVAAIARGRSLTAARVRA